MSAAPPRVPPHATRNVEYGDAAPRAARKLPKATTISAGNGGKMFSIAEMTPIAIYSVPIGSSLSELMIDSAFNSHLRSLQVQLSQPQCTRDPHRVQSIPCLRLSFP